MCIDLIRSKGKYQGMIINYNPAFLLISSIL